MGSESGSPPLVGVTASRRSVGGWAMHLIDESYLDAVAHCVGAVPVMLPAIADRARLEPLLDRLDGVLVTGSASNVEPARYGGPPSATGTLHDPARDAANLALIPAAVRSGVPLLAICRGLQEMNVAYGGTLHQRIQDLPGRIDHREPLSGDADIQFGPAHPVSFVESGLLRRLAGSARDMVNSLHAQGIDRLGRGLAVDAVADDGTIEAVRVEAAPNFALAVQWHPEHRPTESALSRVIFGAFADAVARRRAMRRG